VTDQIGALRAEIAELRARVAALDGPGPRFARIYPQFQDRFRGSEADVRSRLAVYLPRVTEGPVVDVGPGRGEWLTLLAERGIPAYGVEENAALVDRLRARGLDVVSADAVAHLETVRPGSLAVVTAFHVIEHLDLQSLLGLLAAAHRALRPGGLLLLETPDPTNLVMGACNFRFDPTHRQPLPPALTEFLVGAAGFVRVEVWPLHPKASVNLSGLRLGGVDEATAALVAQALRKAFFGPQDYGVVAIRPTP
jgi:SAM-dependent methyltransferase